MAVYKATYCYPFLTAYDTRVEYDPDSPQVKWFSCKVDTSNKDVTGYKIRVLDENNNVLFPVEGDYISPVSELYPTLDGNTYVLNGVTLINQEWQVNKGVNGSYLNIPFFQNKNNKVTFSLNAIYADISLTVAFLIWPGAPAGSASNSANWSRNAEGEYSCGLEDWAGYIDEDVLEQHQLILFLTGSAPNYTAQLMEVNNRTNLVPYTPTFNLTANQNIIVTKGTYHNLGFKVVSGSGSNYTVSQFDSLDIYSDFQGNKVNLGKFGKTLKWEITLYQGNGVVENHNANDEVAGEMNYDSIDVERYYDMTLYQGTILGSRPSRIQVALNDNGNPEDEILPANKDGTDALLYGTWAQLLTETQTPASARIYVNNYDATYGHVYPLASDANTLSIQNALYARFYSHANSIEYIDANERVDVASTTNDGNYSWTGDSIGTRNGNVEMMGLQTIDDIPGEAGFYVLLMHQQNPAENGVYLMQSDANSYVKFGNQAQDLTYVRDESQDVTDARGGIKAFAWSNTSGEGVKKTYYSRTRYLRPKTSSTSGSLCYDSNSCTGSSHEVIVANMITWNRSGSFDTWGDFIGKILFVEQGAENGRKNFESLAQAGGQLLVDPFNYGASAEYDGDSPLYFVPERPMLLFPQKLEDYDVQAFGTVSVSDNQVVVDGIGLKEGQIFLLKQDSTAKLYQVGANNSYQDMGVTFSSVPTYLYINNGSEYGNTVIKITASNGTYELNNLDLCTAKILKNTTTRTYVSPYSLMDSDMILKFREYYIQYSGESTTYDYLRINDANTTLWYITHNTLVSALPSYSPYSANTEIPYTYQLCSFYKTSDENPFYLYETPYINIIDALDEEQNLGLANYTVSNGSDHENYNVYTTIYGYQGQ